MWTDKTIHVNLCNKLRFQSQKEWPVPIKFDIRKSQLKHDSGIKPQGLAVLQGVFDGNVQVSANAKKVHLSMKYLRGIQN